MKTFLARFKISSALNSGTALSVFWRKQVARSPELQRFETSALELDRLLQQRSRLPQAGLPPSLHVSIMRAVREDTAVQDEPSRLRERPAAALALGWSGAAAMALLVIMGGWKLLQSPSHTSRPVPPPVQLVAVTVPLPAVAPLAEQVTSNGAALLVLPVKRQMESLSRDAQDVARFLLASLP
jgi:hypothetical protein